MKGTSIGVKLAVAFGFLIAILIGVGWLGLSRMNQVDADLQDILNRHWAKVELARELEFYENQNNQIAMDIVLLGHKQDQAPLQERRSHNAVIVKDLTTRLDATAKDSPEEKALFTKVVEAKVPYVNSFRVVMALAAQDKTDEAQKVMMEQTLPLRENFYTAREALMQFEESQLNAARATSQTNYAAARHVAIALMSFAIFMATIIAVFVTMRMVREVSQRERAKAAIRALNESLERKVAQRTEELNSAIDKLQKEVNERSEIETALRRSEKNFRSLVENSPYGIMRITPDHKVLQANRALLDILGYASEEELVGLDTSTDVFLSRADHQRAVELYEDKLEVKGVEVEWRRKDGTPISVRYGRHTVTDAKGAALYKEVIVEDITEKRAMEKQLRQGQKMEAVGRLAGGVAHDFNNLLGVIIGYSELLMDQAETAAARTQAEQIKKAGDRASSLTRQLLAFSRQQVLETRVLNMNCVVTEMQKMLPRLIGEDVEILSYLEPKLGNVKADQGQLEQVLMNLAVNARDAMPGGGKLVLKTENVTFHSDQHNTHPGMIPGDYVLLSVSDTGMGMDSQTLAHIFEPFFTTKGRGRGTGLGLATVYGVIKQSGGYIWVDSKPGAGSTFEVYLPRVRQVAEASHVSEPGWTPGHSQTVLLVEDEDSLRELTRTLLEQAGYKILEASDGRQAIEIAQQRSGDIDLLLTDVVMPGMNGRVVAEHLASLHPKMKVIFMSGYTEFAQHVLADNSVNFLQKPFTREVLLRKFNEVLEDSNQRPAESAVQVPQSIEA
jgi:two-component system cell cycle sensor histidine kinase/response regulator CckA